MSFLFFDAYGATRALSVRTHPFPTRRASDLVGGVAGLPRTARCARRLGRQRADRARGAARQLLGSVRDGGDDRDRVIVRGRGLTPRSEEHTSELQSLMRISYAVFCLKKKTPATHTLYQINHNSDDALM